MGILYEWEERGRKVVGKEGGKRDGEKRGGGRKCTETNIK